MSGLCIHCIWGEIISLVSRGFHRGSQAGLLNEVTSLRLEFTQGGRICLHVGSQFQDSVSIQFKRTFLWCCDVLPTMLELYLLHFFALVVEHPTIQSMT